MMSTHEEFILGIVILVKDDKRLIKKKIEIKHGKIDLEFKKKNNGSYRRKSIDNK